jgi:DNA-binding CsgD family transcriptional regulator
VDTPPPVVTENERALLRCLLDNLTNREIAERLGISRPAVGHRLRMLYIRLGMAGRYEAAAWFAGLEGRVYVAPEPPTGGRPCAPPRSPEEDIAAVLAEEEVRDLVRRQPKMKRCLRCTHTFVSAHSEHRICDDCKPAVKELALATPA